MWLKESIPAYYGRRCNQLKQSPGFTETTTCSKISVTFYVMYVTRIYAQYRALSNLVCSLLKYKPNYTFSYPPFIYKILLKKKKKNVFLHQNTFSEHLQKLGLANVNVCMHVIIFLNMQLVTTSCTYK